MFAEIDNGPFRAHFIEQRDAGRLTAAMVARRLDWYRWKIRQGGRSWRPDASRVTRVLGLRPAISHGKMRPPQQTFTYDVAVAMADALELDYTEAGV